MPNATLEPALQHQMLDPCLLGRPVHLLPQFAARLQEDADAAMQGSARRYWAGWRVELAEFGRLPREAGMRWMAAAGDLGGVALAFERCLLLTLLERRYGGRGAGAGASPVDPATERVTATEERLTVVLTQQIVDLLQARVAIDAGFDVAPRPLAAHAVMAAAAPGANAWALRIQVRAGERTGQFWIAPGQALMATILGSLRPEHPGRARPRSQAARGPGEALAARLQVRLDGRLVSKEITLGALFDLGVGDVIPVDVGRADVLLDESRLFTAAVAENKGKLCLTSFEDAE
jgi:flagellar motor switch protein FliM